MDRGDVSIRILVLFELRDGNLNSELTGVSVGQFAEVQDSGVKHDISGSRGAGENVQKWNFKRPNSRGFSGRDGEVPCASANDEVFTQRAHTDRAELAIVVLDGRHPRGLIPGCEFLVELL